MEDSEYFQSSSENNRIKKKEKYFCSKCQKRYKSQLGFSSHLKFNCIKLEEEDDDDDEGEEEEEEEERGQENVRFKHPSCIQLRKRESPKINVRPSKFLHRRKEKSKTLNREEIKSSFRKLTPNTCYSCGKSFNIEYGLARHISEGCLNSLYKCPYCDYQEDNLLLGFFHIIKKHPDLKVYLINKFRGKEKTMSQKMETYLRSLPVLRLSLVQNHTDATKKSSNNRETKSDPKSSTKMSEKEEQQQHSTDTINCPKNCGKVFSKSYSIDHHLKRFCPEVKRYQCAYCKQKFSSFKLTGSHVEEEHSNEQVCAISLHSKVKIYKNPLSERKLERTLAKEQRKRSSSSTSSENSSKRQKVEQPEQESLEKKPKEKENFEKKPKEKESLEKKPKEKENSEKKPKEKENSEKKPKEKENSEKKPREKENLSKMDTGSKKIPCSNGCDRFFTLPRYEKIHVRYCALPKRFQCPYCPVIYKMNTDVTSHITRHHPGMEIYSIDTINEDPKNSSTTLSAIDENRKAETKNQKEPPPVVERHEKRKLHLKCPKCDTIYEHPDDLWEHFQKCPKKQAQNQVPQSPAKPLNDIEFVNISEPEILSQTMDIVGESNDLSYLDILEGPEEMDETLIDIAKDSDSEDEDSCPKELSEEAMNEEVSKFVRMEAENQANQSGEKPVNQFVCPNKCGCKFTKQTTLKIHLSLCCQKPIRFKCPYCEFFTHGESNGFGHVEKYHSNEEISLIDLITRREVHPGKRVITIDENDIECVDLSSEMDEYEQTMEESGGENEISGETEISEENEINSVNESTTILFQCRHCSYSTRKPEEGYLHMKMKHVNESNALICANPPIDDEIQIID